MGNRTLITGAAGFVGRRVARILADRGRRVVALVHTAPRGLAAEWLSHRLIEVQVVDLERPDLESLPRDVGAVLALAQSPYHRDFPARAREIFAVNVSAFFALLEWARIAGVQQVIYASSGGVYGPTAKLNVKESEPVRMDDRLGFYLSTKLSAEVLLQNYRALFPTIAIVRPFFIYGPGQSGEMLIPRLIASVREGKAIKLQGPDGLRLNPIYVEDAAAGLTAALALDGFHILNLGGPEVVTLRAIGDAIGTLMGRQAVFKAMPGLPSDYAGDITRSGELLGPPVTSVVDGLARTIAAEEGSAR